MLHVGMDLSRHRLDVHVMDEEGGLVAETAVVPDLVGLGGLAARYRGRPVRAVIESMNGARFIHDRLEEAGWEVDIADAAKVKGLAPLACKSAWNGRLLPAARCVVVREGATYSCGGADHAQTATGGRRCPCRVRRQ
jgi:hypothetical protein